MNITRIHTIKIISRILLGIMIIHVPTVAAIAQTVNDSCRVTAASLDSITGKPLPFSTIRIFTGQKKTMKTIVADSIGIFSFRKKLSDTVQLSVSFGGYLQKKLVLTQCNAGSQPLSILLVRSGGKNTQATVIAEKLLIKADIDRLIYNMDADPESKTTSLFETMRKVPFITITGDDNVLLKGSGNFKVLVDGRRSSLFENNLRAALRAFPPGTVLRIEVITTPPPKYESEGLSGIINIVTNRKMLDGYSGSINGNISRIYSGTSASTILKKRKLGVSLIASDIYDRLPESLYSNNIFTSGNTSAFSLYQNGTRKNKGNTFTGSAEISYQPDTLNLITASLGVNLFHSWSRLEQMSEMFSGNDIKIQSYRMNRDKRTTGTGMDASLNYQFTAKRNRAQLFTLSFNYSTYKSKDRNSNSIFDKFNFPAPDLLQLNRQGTTEYTGQADYVYPVKRNTIDAGIKFIYRIKDGNFNSFNYDPATGSYEAVIAQDGNVDYDQYIWSFYNSYLIRKKNWGYRLGYRLESNIINAQFTGLQSSFRQDFTNLIPSASLFYTLKNNAGNLRLSYTQRIQRPGVSLLNPFVDKTDPRLYYSGNPTLEPVRNSVIEFSLNRSKKASYNISIGGSFARKVIQQVSGYTADSIILATYQNIGKRKMIESNINISTPWGKKMTFTLNGNLAYVWLSGIAEGTPTKNSGIQGFIFSYLNYRINPIWRIALNGGYYGPMFNLQGSYNSYFYNSIQASKTVFKKKGSITFAIINPFVKYRVINSTITGIGFRQELINKNQFRNFNASFFWQFGKLAESIKKNRRSINNDDKVIPIDTKNQ